jgi:low temperature requirement protein LtrA
VSNGNGLPQGRGVEPAAPGARVTPLELFYDLVFVFAFFTVTELSEEFFTASALFKGVLVLILLWFSWVSFASLGNIVRADQGIMPLVGFATMVPIFLATVTMPDAFADEPPGLPGDLVFALCYLAVRGLQVLAFWYVMRADRRLRRRWRLLALPVMVSTALLVVSAMVPERVLDGGAETAARFGLWTAAIAVEYGADALSPTKRLSVVSVRHLAERYGQIILIAFGEAILSLGTGPHLRGGLPLTWSILVGAALGIAMIAALWWAYADTLALAGEQVLRRAQGAARASLVRDAYDYLHLLMIIGIILFALGLKRVLGVVAERPHVSLASAELYVLSGGVIIYTLAHLGFQLRTLRRSDPVHIVGVVLVAAWILPASRMPAFAALALLTVVVVATQSLHQFYFRHVRREVRTEVLEETRELEAKEQRWRRRRTEE